MRHKYLRTVRDLAFHLRLLVQDRAAVVFLVVLSVVWELAAAHRKQPAPCVVQKVEVTVMTKDSAPAILDQVTLVDAVDQPIGVMDKVAAHRGEGQRHRAISVFLFNAAGQLLIQQRSQFKIVGAGQWANTCCGNVRPTESYRECALRRLREELGITDVTIRPIHKFEYRTRCNAEFSEWEIDTVFVGEYAGPVSPNPKEVAAYEWRSGSQLLAETSAELAGTPLADLPVASLAELHYAPWFHLLLSQPPVAARVAQSN